MIMDKNGTGKYFEIIIIIQRRFSSMSSINNQTSCSLYIPMKSTVLGVFSNYSPYMENSLPTRRIFTFEFGAVSN